MNDRFKFRHWDKQINKMRYGDIQLGCNGIPFTISVGNVIQDIDDVITMQCTGLKDKNGKLIYEGDIVKIGNGSVNGSVIETTREVKWTINTWNVPVWVVDKPNFSHYVEVIGNIYENKELLESEG